MMDEELQKRNTDCVYFLASPLTCKKGMDCDYRHNEIARLNPRDCWYWLAGNCINPTCGFRHPPLDGHGPESAQSESAPLPHLSSAPVNKTSVPCYFYFNGFCNKGDRCSFLHGPDGSVADGKSSKTTSAIANALPSENKTSMGNVGTAPAETHPSPLENASKSVVNMRVLPKDDLLQPSAKVMPTDLPHMSVTESKETVVIKEASMVPAEGFIRTRSHLFTDRSSDEQVDDHIEPEDRWESSPGFDVLVDDDNGSENLGCEDDPDYILAINREHKERNSHLGYNFEDPVEYDPMYPDAELLYEHNACSGYDDVDNEYIFDNVREPPSHARKRMLDSMMARKRKFLPIESFNDHSSVDLRDYLRKRRVVDGNPFISSRRHESSQASSRSQEGHRSHGMERMHGRLASEIGENYMELQRDNGPHLNSANWHEPFMHSNSSRSRQHYKEKRLTKRHSHSSELPRKLVSRESRSTQTISTAFARPKTLAEIKEEKKKAEEHEDCFEKKGHSSITSADFQGPKPLSEILKKKKSLGTETESNARTTVM